MEPGSLFESFFKSAVSAVAGDIDSWVESFDPLKFSRHYKKLVEQKYEQVKVLGMSKPIALSSLYIDVVVLEDIASRNYVDEVELELFVRRIDRSNYNPFHYKRRSALNFVTTSSHSLVLGKPGSGKTTFLRRLLVALLSDTPPFVSFPVYVSLKQFSDTKKSELLDYVASQLAKEYRFPRKTSLPFLMRLLQRGECCLLLDGLDEVDTDRRPEVVAEINSILGSHPRAKVVISCRTADYTGWFASVHEVELADFTTDQALQFFQRWFAEDKGRGAKLIKAFEDSPHLRELCSVPLLAALLCILFQYNLRLPQNRAELYTECIDALLFKWDATRLVNRSSQFAALSTQRKKQLFSIVAKEFMLKGRVVFSRAELETTVQEALMPLNLHDPSAVIDEISSHHALFLERSAGMWSFMHLTFQEYFTATAIVYDRTESALIDNHLQDPRWREVILLTGSLLRSADDFVTYFVERTLSSSIVEVFNQFRPALTMFLKDAEDGGLKESKDFIDALWKLAGSEKTGSNKVTQIKAIRTLYRLFSHVANLSEDNIAPGRGYGISSNVEALGSSWIISALAGRNLDQVAQELDQFCDRLEMFVLLSKQDAAILQSTIVALANRIAAFMREAKT